MYQPYIDTLSAKVTTDQRIKAAWLEGSFGRGTSDRYSDLDFHFLMEEHELSAFRANIEAWLSTIRPLVLCTLMFEGRMVNALTRDGLRLDLWFPAGDSMTLDPTKVQVVFNRGDSLHFRPEPAATDPVAVAQRLERQTQEFWQCMALLPAVVGRQELLTAFAGLSVELNLVTELLLTGYGIARDRGVKTLNQFLPPALRQALEAALSLHGLSPASLTKAHLALARIVQQQGRLIAAKHQYAYPEELEEVVLYYVSKELALLGLNENEESKEDAGWACSIETAEHQRTECRRGNRTE